MSGERLQVDVDALRRGGVDIEAITTLAAGIHQRLRVATQTYRFAGGTGDMGEKFDTGYRPGELQGLKFLNLLSDVVGEAGGRTVTTAESFARTDEDATSAVRES